MIKLQPKYRQAIARIRASSHHLGIELGRHTKPKPTPIENRLCLYCSSNSIDNEFHFVLKCQKNNKERGVLFKNLSPQIVNQDSDILFRYIFNNNVELHIKAFGKLLVDSFEARQPPDNGLCISES